MIVVNPQDKRVTANLTFKQITVTNNDTGETITVQQPISNLITVNHPGPIGPQGPVGSISGSSVPSASFASSGDGIFSGSFSGSFEGDGSSLTGIVSSKWTGSSDISRLGNVSITGSLEVTGSISASSFTGSLSGTSSYALSAPSEVFTSDFTVVLSNSKTFGKYSNGQIVSASGLTPREVILLAAIEYINPSWNSFSISGQSQTLEVGTTVSGSKTFTWSIATGSGVVSTIDIVDTTSGSTLVTDTSNDGTQALNIGSYQLNSDGSTRVYRGTLHDTGTVTQNISSSTFTITSRYYRFYGPTGSSPTNSTEVRALPTSSFHTANTFTLSTGITAIKFVVALPPTKTITSVIDLDALNVDITSAYVLTGNINVLDAGGTNRSYNIYEMNVATPYSTNHRHSIIAT